jgi:enamine deaminase RidA (YjgF/YER057c/UK114 family)
MTSEGDGPALETNIMRFAAAVTFIGYLSPALAYAEPELRLINPPGLFQPSTFSQIATVRDGRLVLISGQTARDAQSNIVGRGDLRAQTLQVFENLKLALAGVGAEFADVAKLTTYVVNLKPDDRLMIADVIGSYFPTGRRPAHTLVGVSALAVEGLLIEIEAIALSSD